jgi:predicted ATPase
VFVLPEIAMSLTLRRLSARGYKSIESLSAFDPGRLSILIGANGAGKSNFIELFRFLPAIAAGELQALVASQGGPARFFFLGPKVTPVMEIGIEADGFDYALRLTPGEEGRIVIASESLRRGDDAIEVHGRHESLLSSPQEAGEEAARDLIEQFGAYLAGWTVYHFHYVAAVSPMRASQPVEQPSRLAPDGSNIAAFLSHLRDHHSDHYTLIRDTVRLVVPFFDDFRLEENGSRNAVHAVLGWKQQGAEMPFLPRHLSDGTIRFVCLAASLLQPQLPPTVVIDEPELGLHPFALAILGDLIVSASERSQVIISTQSPALLDAFDPGAVVVVNRRAGASVFERIDPDTLGEWTDDYTIGELWLKNVVEGGPRHE